MDTDSEITEEDILEEDDVETTPVEDEIPSEETPEEAVEEETDEEAPAFEKRFTQFKGETPEEYLKNLEDGYGNSSTEATRLAQQAKDLQQRLDQVAGLVANDPDFAAKLQGAEASPSNPLTTPQNPLADPALFYARQTMEQQMEKEYNAFVADHREMETDPALAKQITEYLSVLSDAHLRKTGKLLTMSEGLKAAWVMAGQSLSDSEEETRMAVKNSAAQSKSPTGGAPVVEKRSQFTKAQLDFARRAWPEKKAEELEEMLSQYVNQ